MDPMLRVRLFFRFTSSWSGCPVVSLIRKEKSEPERLIIAKPKKGIEASTRKVTNLLSIISYQYYHWDWDKNALAIMQLHTCSKISQLRGQASSNTSRYPTKPDSHGSH
jgi:hypothetical protein